MPRIWESDLAKYVRSGERARTIDHGGTLLSSTMKIGPLPGTYEEEVTIFLMPIRVHAALTKIRFMPTDANLGSFAIAVHRMDNAGRYEGPAALYFLANMDEETEKDVTTNVKIANNWGLSIHELIVGGFNEFLADITEDEQYVMLSMWGPGSSFPPGLSIYMKIQYVEPSPSEIRRDRFSLYGEPQ